MTRTGWKKSERGAGPDGGRDSIEKALAGDDRVLTKGDLAAFGAGDTSKGTKHSRGSVSTLSS